MIKHVKEFPQAYRGANSIIWENCTPNEDFEPIEMPASSSGSVQISGIFGANGSVALEGSNDGIDFFTIDDIHGDPIRRSSGGIMTVGDRPRYIRPSVSGDASVNVKVVLFFKPII